MARRAGTRGTRAIRAARLTPMTTRSHVTVDAADLRPAARSALGHLPLVQALEALEARFPGLRDRLCDSTPAIRRHINVFVDGSRAGLEDRLAEGAELVVLTAISGG